MLRCCLPLIILLSLTLPAAAQSPQAKPGGLTDTVWNMTRHRYEDAPVRLRVDVSGLDPKRLVVTSEGEPVPHQIGEEGRVWVMVTLGPGEAKGFEVKEGEGGKWPEVEDGTHSGEEVAGALGVSFLSGANRIGCRDRSIAAGFYPGIIQTVKGSRSRSRALEHKPYLIVHERTCGTSRGRSGRLI